MRFMAEGWVEKVEGVEEVEKVEKGNWAPLASPIIRERAHAGQGTETQEVFGRFAKFRPLVTLLDFC